MNFILNTRLLLRETTLRGRKYLVSLIWYKATQYKKGWRRHTSSGGGGAGIAQWLEHRTRDWKVAGSNPCWNGGRIFFSRVDFLCWLLFRYPFHPRVTTVARKKSRSFCQKCRAGYSRYVDIEPCFGRSQLVPNMSNDTEDIKHQLIIIITPPPGAGIAQWLSWLKGRGFESLLERRENFLLQGRLSVLTLISVSVPPPCYHSST